MKYSKTKALKNCTSIKKATNINKLHHWHINTSQGASKITPKPFRILELEQEAGHRNFKCFFPSFILFFLKASALVQTKSQYK